MTLSCPHSKLRFPASSSKLCQNWLRHCMRQQLSTDTVKAIRKVLGTLMRLWKHHSAQART